MDFVPERHLIGEWGPNQRKVSFESMTYVAPKKCLSEECSFNQRKALFDFASSVAWE